MAKIDAESVFAELEPAITALRDLARFGDFGSDAPALSPEAAQAKVATLEAAFRPHADAINARLASLSKALDAAEKAKAPAGPAAMMTLAARQRTCGPPDPLPALFHENPDSGTLTFDDWASVRTFAEARRRYFLYWFGVLEGFRRNAVRRAAALDP